VAPFAEITGALGSGFDIMLVPLDVAEQPLELVYVTVYDPEEVTVIV
jgi:hypothetical protein